MRNRYSFICASALLAACTVWGEILCQRVRGVDSNLLCRLRKCVDGGVGW